MSGTESINGIPHLDMSRINIQQLISLNYFVRAGL